MARKPRASQSPETDPAPQAQRAQGNPPPPTGAVRDRIVDALMALAAERRWDDITLPMIAQRAGVSLADFRDHFPSKGAILGAFSRRIDREVLEGNTGDLADEPVRERVFDVLMRRIDALTPYKEALRRISGSLSRDPLALAALNQVALNAMRFMLAAANVDTEGRLGAVKLQGGVIILARTLDVWYRDDDPGLARTMAALDRELRRGGRVLQGLTDACRLAAPFRALFDAAAEGGRRFRERERTMGRRPTSEDNGDDDVIAV